MNKNVRYGYFTVDTPKGKGYVCVRLQRLKCFSDTAPINAEATFSFCSPMDAPKEPSELGKNFKRKARAIADSRAESNRINQKVEIQFNPSISQSILFREILNKATQVDSEKKDKNGRHYKVAPDWVRNAMKQERVSFGLPTSKPSN